MRWACRACGCRYAPGAPCCPQCRATAHDEEAAQPAGQEDEVPKIDRFGAVTTGPVTSVHASAILPDGAQVHPGSGALAQGVEHPADGTTSPPAANKAPAAPAPPAPPRAAAKPAATPPPSRPATPPATPAKKSP